MVFYAKKEGSVLDLLHFFLRAIVPLKSSALESQEEQDGIIVHSQLELYLWGTHFAIHQDGFSASVSDIKPPKFWLREPKLVKLIINSCHKSGQCVRWKSR